MLELSIRFASKVKDRLDEGFAKEDDLFNTIRAYRIISFAIISSNVVIIYRNLEIFNGK